MKRLLLLCLLPVLIASCSYHGVVSMTGLKMIRAVRYRTPADSIVEVYTNRASMKRIVRAINRSKKQPLQFRANCRLHFIYADSTVTLLLKGSSMRLKEQTYKLDDTIVDILN